ncbi:MAG: adenosylmethionine--8-amino-7-oxononanoate transaminase [Syntrophales bacterium]|jgi:adenosylmethionine-8-amino-7-oxononanoate aminotransferase
MKDYQYLDKKHIWHPCSQMMDYETYPATLIERAEGVWLYKENGERLLDAISSWWVNLFGHGNTFIADRIKNQLELLDHVLFANYTHKPAIDLAAKLATLFDNQLDKVFYTDNGSSSVEAALKMSFHYWHNVGKPQKIRFANLKGAYHGETLGALSVGSMDAYKKIYSPLLTDSVEIEGPDCFRCAYGLDRLECDAECYQKTEQLLEKNHATLCAVIVEPIMQCAAGMKMYSPRYLKKLRDQCTGLGIHLICDEIAVGFGRTGTMMASYHAGIVPDIVTISKTVTGGFLPLAAVLTGEEIFGAFYAPYEAMKAFMHSHTYSGNPLACAAGCAVFDLFEQTSVLESNCEKSSRIREGVLSLDGHPHVGEIRTMGMITALDLVKDKKTKEPFDWRQRIGYQIYRLAEKKGVLLRNLGDVIYFMPPYVIAEEEIDFMTGVAVKSIREVLG